MNTIKSAPKFDPSSLPVSYSSVFRKQIYLLASGLFLTPLSIYFFMAPSNEGTIIEKIYAWTLGFFAFGCISLFIARTRDRKAFTLRSDGVDLRYLGFIKWDDVERIQTRSGVCSFEFKYTKGVRQEIPAYKRLLEGIYKKPNDIVGMSFNLKGLNESTAKIREAIRVTYSAYLSKKFDIDLNATKENLDKEKLAVFLEKLGAVYQL